MLIANYKIRSMLPLSALQCIIPNDQLLRVILCVPPLHVLSLYYICALTYNVNV